MMFETTESRVIIWFVWLCPILDHICDRFLSAFCQPDQTVCLLVKYTAVMNFKPDTFSPFTRPSVGFIHPPVGGRKHTSDKLIAGKKYWSLVKNLLWVTTLSLLTITSGFVLDEFRF